jgi:hypothetical protein
MSLTQSINEIDNAIKNEFDIVGHGPDPFIIMIQSVLRDKYQKQGPSFESILFSHYKPYLNELLNTSFWHKFIRLDSNLESIIHDI